MTSVRARFVSGLLAVAMFGQPASSTAGGHPRRRAVSVAPTAIAARAIDDSPSPMLGSFYSTPFIVVGGDSPLSGGYSPLGAYGSNSSLTLVGPISAYRSTAAPVRVYSRGYDGRVYEREATSFSTPNFPLASPVVYPTLNSNYDFPRGRTVLPRIPASINWLDQN